MLVSPLFGSKIYDVFMVLFGWFSVIGRVTDLLVPSCDLQVYNYYIRKWKLVVFHTDLSSRSRHWVIIFILVTVGLSNSIPIVLWFPISLAVFVRMGRRNGQKVLQCKRELFVFLRNTGVAFEKFF